MYDYMHDTYITIIVRTCTQLTCVRSHFEFVRIKNIILILILCYLYMVYGYVPIQLQETSELTTFLQTR